MPDRFRRPVSNARAAAARGGAVAVPGGARTAARAGSGPPRPGSPTGPPRRGRAGRTRGTADQVNRFLETGTAPPVLDLDLDLDLDLERTIKDSSLPGKDWLWFVYDLATKFQLSWDQALPSTSADPLLTNIDRVFLGQLEPERFGQEMSKVTGS